MKDRRSQIVQAAAALMNERGFQQTSIDDVIRHAGLCGKGHFYHHFRSKEELGHAVLEHRLERFTERGLALLREPMIAPLDRLNLFIDTIVASHLQHDPQGGSPLGTLASEMADVHDAFRQQVAAAFERWAEQIHRVLTEARSQLSDSTDPRRVATFIVAALEGALFMSRIKRDRATIAGIAA